jgi:hypothetical protein
VNATDYDVNIIQAALREQRERAERLEEDLVRAREELEEVAMERDRLVQRSQQLQETRDFYKQAS